MHSQISAYIDSIYIGLDQPNRKYKFEAGTTVLILYIVSSKPTSIPNQANAEAT